MLLDRCLCGLECRIHLPPLICPVRLCLYVIPPCRGPGKSHQTSGARGGGDGGGV